MKKDQEKEELTKLLKDHPIIQKIKEEKAAEVLKKRTEAAEKIKNLEKERDKLLPALRAELTEKESKYNELKAALNIAASEFYQAKVALSSKSIVFENLLNSQKDILLETAAPEVDSAIEFFREKLSFLRSPGRISRILMGSELNPINMRRKLKAESNSQAIHNAIFYCQNCIKELGAMKLTPALDTQKIDQMKNKIPDIAEYSEVAA